MPTPDHLIEAVNLRGIFHTAEAGMSFSARRGETLACSARAARTRQKPGDMRVASPLRGKFRPRCGGVCAATADAV